MNGNSLNVGIWRVMALYDLLVPTETIWKFKTNAGKRIKDDSKYLAVSSWNYTHYDHSNFKWSGGVIEAGEYKKTAYEYAEVEGIKLCPL